MHSAPTVADPPRWVLRLPRGREWVLGARPLRPLVMGVLNITPDSFSDGGRWLDRDRALEHALRMLESGADLLDLGAESTRPGGAAYGEGAETVAAERELDRLLPVLEGLRPLTSVPLSVDTRKGTVARAALDAGADVINDVGGLADPDLGRAVAAAGCPLVLMHCRGDIQSMQTDVSFDDVVGDVARELEDAVARAEATGVDRSQILLDPGIGYGKNIEHNVGLMARLSVLGESGLPLLLGASRKSFIGDLTGDPVESRLPGSLAAAAWAALQGAAVVRVHDVAETVQFLDVFEALQEGATA